MALDWKDVEEDGEPEVEGQYAVYCYNYQISSDLIDIARYEGGSWGMFRSCLNYGMRVRAWAELNWPEKRLFLREMEL